mgnify:CR=1 FL=1
MKLNETIEFHIKTTSLALTRMYNSIAAEYGITQTMGYILTYVSKEGTPSTKLATELGMKKSSLTRMLKKMEDEGLIFRETNQVDKRIVKVFLSEDGVNRRKIAKSTVVDFNEKLLQEVSQDDLAIFIKVSDIIKNQVESEMNLQNI